MNARVFENSQEDLLMACLIMISRLINGATHGAIDWALLSSYRLMAFQLIYCSTRHSDEAWEVLLRFLAFWVYPAWPTPLHYRPALSFYSNYPQHPHGEAIH